MCCPGFSFTVTECSKSIFIRALLIAKKLKAKQGRKEENSVDKLAEKVSGHCYNIATCLICSILKVLARKDDDAAAKGFEGGVELVLDQTAEFCRGLGEVG